MEKNTRKQIDEKIDWMETTKITITPKVDRISFPKQTSEILKLKEYHKKGEETYMTFRIRNGEIVIKLTDKVGNELYPKENDNNE